MESKEVDLALKLTRQIKKSSDLEMENSLLKQALDFIYNDVLTDIDSDDYITKFELTRQAIEVALDIKQNQQGSKNGIN